MPAKIAQEAIALCPELYVLGFAVLVTVTLTKKRNISLYLNLSCGITFIAIYSTSWVAVNLPFEIKEVK